MARIIRLAASVLFLFFSLSASAEPWAWVWYPGMWQKPANTYLGRLTFTVEEDVTTGYVFFSGDNFSTLYLNGQRIAGSGDWYTLKPVTIETMRPLLRQGKNVLAARVQNDDHEGGFILKGMILLASGKRVSLNSNESWRCANTPVEGWQEVGFDDSEWVPSECIGTPPAGPWGCPTLPPSRHSLGFLNVGDPESEEQFGYSGEGRTVAATLRYADGTRLRDTGRRIARSESFTVQLGTPGYLVLRRRLADGQAGDIRVAVDGSDAGLWHSAAPSKGRWTDAYFVVPNELTANKPQVALTLAPVMPGSYVAYRYDFMTTFEWYMFSAGATGSLDREALAAQVRSAPNDPVAAFRYALALEGERRWAEAVAAYRRCADLAAGSDLGGSAHRGACLAQGMNAVRGAAGDATRLYEIGLYLKLNGFHAAAIEALRASIAARPTADAYDQLGEAMLFGGEPVEEFVKVWRMGLKQFPPKDTNHWSCIVALRPKPEQEAQIPAQEEQLQIMLDMIYLCSRGRLALDARIMVNPPPREKLYGVGELDSLITVAGGGGGGATLGPGVVYGKAAWSGVGFVCPWDVIWHEWIHQFECGLHASGNGLGWGGCHSSTQFGYRPPWWNWYRAAMRYYVRPGQYQRACIVDHADVPYADKWLVKGPFPSPEIAPEWLCSPGKRNTGNFAWNTRKTFALDEKPAKATLAVTGDDRHVAYVNGRRVGAGASWMYAPTVEITEHLRKGENVIAISAKNDEFTGGLLAYADIEFESGRLMFGSDESWKTQPCDVKEFNKLHAERITAGPAWTKPGFDDSDWVTAEVIGKYPCGPWNVIRISLPDTLMITDWIGPSQAAPAVADGWNAVELKTKVAKLSEIAPPPDETYQTLTYAFTYVYAPADMRVQMSMGASRRAFVVLNGELIREHRGNGDTTLPRVLPIYLRKGWNRLLFRAEDLRQESVFWVKIYRPDGKPIEGLRYSNKKPASGLVPDQQTLPYFDPARPRRYRWTDVADDPYTLMPRLMAADLAALSGYKDLAIVGGNNFLFVDCKGGNVTAGYKALTRYTGGEREVNNALTWDFEPVAVVRYARQGKTRDLLLVKPDALELVFETNLLKVLPGSVRPAERIIGWLLEGGRLCVVAEAELGELPQRTMDMLTVD